MVLSALKNVDFEIFVKIRGFPNSGFSLLSLSLSLPSSSSASDSLFLLLRGRNNLTIFPIFREILLDEFVQ